MTEVLSKEQITANIENWCQALESGAYPQTKGRLEDDKGYCCLGVACKVLGLRREDDSTSLETFFSYDGENSVAPDSLMRKLGLNSSIGTYEIPDGEGDFCDLTELNDSAGWNFKQIADLIRSRPKGLFIEGV